MKLSGVVVGFGAGIVCQYENCVAKDRLTYQTKRGLSRRLEQVDEYWDEDDQQCYGYLKVAVPMQEVEAWGCAQLCLLKTVKYEALGVSEDGRIVLRFVSEEDWVRDRKGEAGQRVVREWEDKQKEWDMVDKPRETCGIGWPGLHRL